MKARATLPTRRLPGALLVLGLMACGDDGPSPEGACADVPATAVEVGRSLVVAPSLSGGCVVVPSAGGGAAEYLLAVVSGAGQQVPAGIQGAFVLESRVADRGGAPASVRGAALGTLPAPSRAGRFHAMLRAREASAAERASLRGGVPARRAARALVAPPEGSARTFQVCATLTCDAYVAVAATARVVGRNVAIYLDDTVPAGGLSETDLADLGELFDRYLHPIDTTAFGRESDLDADGVVSVLLSDAVNDLSGDCADGSVVLGYFLGSDLLPDEPGSNGGEVFYGRVPSAAAPACRHDRNSVLRFLAPTFIHEFQHMISFNQHVLLRGSVPEAVWLNEGLSHFAEELGGRLIPNGPAQGGATSREAQFLTGDLTNALDYLLDPESHFLVTPGASFGTPAERGASWLFVRWLADHFGDADAFGASLTRALLATSDVGGANVAARTGVPFDELVGTWQLANYLDDLEGFTPLEDRLQYRSVNLRSSLATLWPRYPLSPDVVSGPGYRHAGILRAGSGRHLRVVLAPGAAPAAFVLSGSPSGALDPLLAARVSVTRIR